MADAAGQPASAVPRRLPALAARPRPWAYNPSAWSQRVPVAIFGGLACVIAVYMALFQWGLIGSVWDPVFGAASTERVLTSDASHTMSRWFRVPDAALGALAYLGDVIFALAGSTRRWQYRPWLVVLFGLDVIPLGLVSVILVVIQGVVIGSWCLMCLVTAAISLLLIWYAYDEVWSCVLFLYTVWRRARSPRVLWDAFWGRPSRTAHEVSLELARPPEDH